MSFYLLFFHPVLYSSYPKSLMHISVGRASPFCPQANGGECGSWLLLLIPAVLCSGAVTLSLHPCSYMLTYVNCAESSLQISPCIWRFEINFYCTRKTFFGLLKKCFSHAGYIYSLYKGNLHSSAVFKLNLAYAFIQNLL